MPRLRPDELSDDARRVWQSRTTRPLGAEDEREIRQNLVGFFGVLREWAAREAGEEPSVDQSCGEDETRPA